MKALDKENKYFKYLRDNLRILVGPQVRRLFQFRLAVSNLFENSKNLGYQMSFKDTIDILQIRKGEKLAKSLPAV